MKKSCLGFVLFCFVALGAVCTTEAIVGEDWFLATPEAEWAGRHSFVGLVYDDAMWVMSGRAGGNQVNDVWHSADGANWTEATMAAPWGTRLYAGGLVFDEKIWIMGGGQWGDTGYLNDVWHSTDGVAWTQATASAPWSQRGSFACMVYDGKMWVIGGFDMTNRLNDVWCSSDGVTWTQVTDAAPWPPRRMMAGLVFDGKMWILGGQTEGGPIGDVWCSSDGLNWIPVTPVAGWTATFKMGACVFDGKMWVMGGQEGTGGNNEVWCSSDGAAWTQVTDSADWIARNAHVSLAFQNAMWVLGGSSTPSGDTAFLNDVWYTSEPISDRDADGISDDEDNCPDTPNPGQEDADADGFGDLCDPCPLDPLNDADGDGFCGDVDACDDSDLRETVYVLECDSGVANWLGEDGCTLADIVHDLVWMCADGAKNHGRFVRCMAHVLNDLKKAKVISGKEKGALQSCVARSSIPSGPLTDEDGDGIYSDEDLCDDSDLRETVYVLECDSGVANWLGEDGCTLADVVNDVVLTCADGAKNHGQFVSRMSRALKKLKKAKVISGKEKGALQRCAAQADIP